MFNKIIYHRLGEEEEKGKEYFYKHFYTSVTDLEPNHMDLRCFGQY